MCSGDFGEIAVRAAVDVGHGHDVAAGCEALEDGSRGGGARGEGERVFGVLESCNCLLEVFPRLR